MGQGKWSSKYKGKTTKEYATWLHMIRRCYSKDAHIEFPSYKDVTVCERWHCFQNFCEDIQNLSGYNQWKNESSYELDKDILCSRLGISPKIYSMETCMFISKKENLSESTTRKNLTGLTYIGVSPYGEEQEFTNQKEFAEKHNLTTSLVSACINKTREQHKGWTFRIKNKQIIKNNIKLKGEVIYYVNRK